MRGRHRGKNTVNRASMKVNYHNVIHPFEPQSLFSEDKIEAIHHKALEALETLGIVFLLPEARDIFKSSGALIEGELVKIGRELVENALNHCPKTIDIKAPLSVYDRTYDKKSLLFAPAGGCPNVSDSVRGRRPGHSESFLEAVKLTQMMDVLHVQTVAPEPQDVPLHLRHIFMTETQLSYCDKIN